MIHMLMVMMVASLHVGAGAPARRDAMVHTAVRAPAHVAAPDSMVCIDPATPLLELARTYAWPAPAGDGDRKAFAELRRYMAAPTPRAYHEVLASYKWLDMYHSDVANELALGILYASGYDLNYPTAEGYRHNAISNNSNANDYAARALNYVSQHDSSQWLAAIALTRIALVSPEQQSMDDAVAAVNRSLHADPSSVPLRLAWHDLLIAQERARDALAFDRARPVSCAPLAHAMAEALLLTGDTAAGVHLYLQTLNHAEPGELHRFRDDIRVLATQADLKSYAALPPSRRAAWISDYWKFSATSFARSLEARVTEQMVRAAFADTHFRATEFAVTNDKPNWVDDTAHIVPWDARGVTYVRHGAPMRRLQITHSCAEAYEVWVYSGEGQPSIVWFAHNCLSPMSGGNEDVMNRRNFDWRPIYGPPSCGRAFLTRPVPTLVSAISKLEKEPDDIDRRDLYTLLAQYDPRYGSLLHECAKVPVGEITPHGAAIVETLDREGRQLFNRMKWSEDALPQYSKRVAMMIGAYEFEDGQHHSELAAFTWVNLADLPASASATNRMRYSFVVTDGPMHATRTDTSVAIPIHGADSDMMLRSMVIVPEVKTGTGFLRVFATDASDSTRGGVRSAPMEIHGYPSKHGMSDIVIAMPTETGVLHRGALSIEPLPGHIVAMDHEFRVFFETYGVASGEIVQTSISVTRTDPKTMLQQLRALFPGKVDARTVTFSNPAEIDARGVMVRDVTMAGEFVPGTYRVDVTIKTANGDIVTKHTALIVTEPPTK